MIRPDEIAQAVLGILSVQSVYALVLFPLVWGLVKCCRGRYPLGHLIRSLTPYLVSRPFLAFPHAPLIFPDHQKPLAASLPDAFILDGQNPHGMVQTIGSRPATVPPPTAREWFCLIICSAWLAVVSLLLALFLRKRRRFWKIAGQGRTVLDPAVLDVVRTIPWGF